MEYNSRQTHRLMDIKKPAYLSEYVEKYGNGEDLSLTNKSSSMTSVDDPTKLNRRTLNLDIARQYSATTAKRDTEKILREGNLDEIRETLKRIQLQNSVLVNQISAEDCLSPLHVAVRRGNAAITQLLLQHGALTNVHDEDEKQPVHYAAKHYKPILSKSVAVTTTPESLRHGMEEACCLHILLENGADVNARDRFQSTPLHYASDRGHLGAVEILIKTGKANLQARDDHMSTPIHEAAKHGHADILRLVLSNANNYSKLLDCKDDNGCTPLILACRDGFNEAAAVLLEFARKVNCSEVVSRLLDKNNDLDTPIHVATESGSVATVRLLLETWDKEVVLLTNRYDELAKDLPKYIDIRQKHGNTPLHLVAHHGSLETLTTLCNGKPNIEAQNNNQETALWIAAQRNNLNIAEALLNIGANMEMRNVSGMTSLMVACRDGHPEIVKLLIARGANTSCIDAKERNCCILAAAEGRTDILKILLSLGSGQSILNSCDHNGNTSLHAAAIHGEIESIKVLLTQGANLDQRNDKEQTALHLASYYGRIEVVRELVLRERSLLNDQDEQSRTPLHLAASNGQTSTIRVLIQLGANLGDVDSKGRTALDVCVATGCEETATILLDNFPQLVHNKTRDMETPLHLACQFGHRKIVNLLLKRNADVTSRLPDGRNPLDVAIDNRHELCVLSLIHHVSWKESLKNATKLDNSEVTLTPLRKLVEDMPDAAELVLTKCMTTNDSRPEDPSYAITFNYEFLDDTYEIPTWIRQDPTDDNQRNNRPSYRNRAYELDFNDDTNAEASFDHDRKLSKSKLSKQAQPYCQHSATVLENHVLTKMVLSNNVRLLHHPTVSSLLNHKWRKFARYIYWANLIFYLIFFLVLNIYMSVTPPRFAINITETTTQVEGGNDCIMVINDAQEVWGSTCIPPSNVRYVFTSLIIAVSAIQLAKEAFQMYHQKMKYFLDFTNVIELILYSLSILVFVDIDPLAHQTGLREKWQWECGAFAVLLSWFNLILYVRRSSWLGIYVFMVISVGFTFLKFAVVLFLFVVGFSMAFYVLLQNQYAFYTPLSSIVKTLVMMIGEMDYATIFLAHYESTLYHEVVQYDSSSNVIFVVFAIFMGLLLTNLLVGLAVDDISSVQDQASLKRVALQIDGILDMEYAMPLFIRRRWVALQRRVEPNKFAGKNGILRWFLEEKELKQKYIQNTISPPSTELDKLQRDIRDLKQDITAMFTIMKGLSRQRTIMPHGINQDFPESSTTQNKDLT